MKKIIEKHYPIKTNLQSEKAHEVKNVSNQPCPSCESRNTEIYAGKMKCFDCGWTVKGIILFFSFLVFLFFILN